MWSIEFPNLQKLSTQFPYVDKIPKSASDIIVERMNLKSLSNGWQSFVSQRWPTYTSIDMEIKFTNQMESVLFALVSEGEKTTKLLDLLEKIIRKDILVNLEEYCRYLFFNPLSFNAFC